MSGTADELALARRVGRSALREQTRARLLDFGRRAFARKGLAAANLKDDILTPGGVSASSSDHLFGDKTELFLVVIEEHIVAGATAEQLR